MATRPLIIFPKPKSTKRKNIVGGSSNVHFPLFNRQIERLLPQFEDLQRQFEEKARLQISASGTTPEEVIVLEIVGTVEEFISAVRRIDGMEWLAEWDENDIPIDEDFYKITKKGEPDPTLSGRLFLVMTNQRAMGQFLSLWDSFKSNPNNSLPHYFGRFKEVFARLRQVRIWDVRDRLIENRTIEYWRESLQIASNQFVITEIELWFRETKDDRLKRAQEVKKMVTEASGEIISESVIQEINYHAILVRLPRKYVENIIKTLDARLIKCEQIMFFRPSGQTAVKIAEDEPEILDSITQHPEKVKGSPIVALLDGVPLQGHKLLADRVLIDDPDDWASKSLARSRYHGTAMASLIIHGELGANEKPLSTPLYIRPILLSEERDEHPKRELIPEEVLPVDLIFRAVRRIFDGDGNEAASAKSIKIINVSIGDTSRPFDYYLSPLARLLDWLSWNYQVLIIVSAGNYTDDITIEVDPNGLHQIPAEKLQELALIAVAKEIRNRRILSPAEAINVVTVAASHEDKSDFVSRNDRLNIHGVGMPSPLNALGLGFRRSVKPDLLTSGGRQFYKQSFISNEHAVLTVDSSFAAPGNLVASPSAQSGVLNATRYTRGTSNATALTTRIAYKSYERLSELRKLPEGNYLPEKATAALLKTMLVHGTHWGDAITQLELSLKTEQNKKSFREFAARFLGYGFLNSEKSLTSSDQRATIIGAGVIAADKGHLFTLPLPESLSGQSIWRRLTITLGWLSPTNCAHRAYRRAALWFAAPTTEIQVNRREVDYRASMRGTVQHEVLEGEKAVAFKHGHSIQIQVNCRVDAGNLEEEIPYGLMVTLEVAEGEKINVWQEISNSIKTPVRVQSNV